MCGHSMANAWRANDMNNSEQHRFECECREWLHRIRQQTKTFQEGKNMLTQLIADIAKKRGQAAADRLLAGIIAARGAA